MNVMLPREDFHVKMTEGLVGNFCKTPFKIPESCLMGVAQYGLKSTAIIVTVVSDFSTLSTTNLQTLITKSYDEHPVIFIWEFFPLLPSLHTGMTLFRREPIASASVYSEKWNRSQRYRNTSYMYKYPGMAQKKREQPQTLPSTRNATNSLLFHSFQQIESIVPI